MTRNTASTGLSTSMKAVYISMLVVLVTSVALGQNICELDLIAAQGSTSGRFEEQGVNLSENDYIIWIYRATMELTIGIQNVEYANKVSGQSDSSISLYIDENIIASHTTSISSSNQVMNSGIIGQKIVLPRGRHTVRLEVTHTDVYGLQINGITAEFTAPEFELQFTCPHIVPSDNSGLSTTESVIIGVVSTFVAAIMGIVATCVLFCIKIYRKQKQSDPAKEPLAHPDKSKETKL